MKIRSNDRPKTFRWRAVYGARLLRVFNRSHRVMSMKGLCSVWRNPLVVKGICLRPRRAKTVKRLRTGCWMLLTMTTTFPGKIGEGQRVLANIAVEELTSNTVSLLVPMGG
jgi:hypothetical protein